MFMEHAKAASELRKLLSADGDDLVKDLQRLRGILKDTGVFPVREANILWIAADAKIPANLKDPVLPLPSRERLGCEKLMNSYSLTEEAAAWSVEVWKLCLHQTGPSPRGQPIALDPDAFFGVWNGAVREAKTETRVSLTLDKPRGADISAQLVVDGGWSPNGGLRAPISAAMIGTIRHNGEVDLRSQQQPGDVDIRINATVVDSANAYLLKGKWKRGGVSGSIELAKRALA